MTRGMFVTVLGRMAGADIEKFSGPPVFSDVSDKAYYAPYVAWAAEYGITTGTGNGKFSPDELINREQLAVFFVRYFEIFDVEIDTGQNIESLPADLDEVSEYARDAVCRLWKTGLLGGDGVNFNPKANASRAEAAALCMRADRAVEVWNKEPGVPSDKKREPIEQPGENEDKKPEGSSGGGSSVYYEVEFAAGDGINESISYMPEKSLYRSGTKISELPTPYSRGYIFTGWYYDSGMTEKAAASDTLKKNLKLYAKMSRAEDAAFEETPSYLTKRDTGTDFTFSVKADSVKEVLDALTVTQITANNAVLPVSAAHISGSGGIFTVSYPYEAGHTYRARLDEDSDAVFVDADTPQPHSVRDLNFITAKQEVMNLSINDDVIFIKKSDVGNMSDDLAGLFVVSLDSAEPMRTVKNSGSFSYSGSEALKAGDTVAIYEGTRPDARTLYTDNDGIIVYVNITGKNGNTYTYNTSDSEDILFTPDVLPISKSADRDGSDSNGSITVDKADVDFSDDRYAQMGLDSQTVIEAGDYIAFYEGAWGARSAGGPEYAVITGVSEVSEGSDRGRLVITYSEVTVNEVMSSMDIYSTRNEDIELTPVQIAQLEREIEEQAVSSGFAKEAADYLVGIAMATDGFEQLDNMENVTYSVQSISAPAGTVYAAGSKPDVKSKVEAEITRELDHFKGSRGLRAVLKLECEITFQKEGSDNQFVITLEAEFEQEVLLDINISGGAIWKWAWIIPYIYDFQINASFDVGTFTGIAVTATMATGEDDEGDDDEDGDDDKDKDDDKDDKKEDGDKDDDGGGSGGFLGIDWGSLVNFDQSVDDYAVNLGSQIEKLMDKRDEFMGEDAEDEDEEDDDPMSGLMEKYSEMISEADDSWIDLVRKEIFSLKGYVDPLCILAYEISADFVIKANVYITLGMTFEYGNAKRYNFSLMLFHKKSTNETIDLETEHYEFVFYVMGTLGIKVGVEFEIAVGLISTKLDSIGITAETGAYAQLWGYFYYKLWWEAGSEQQSICAGALSIEIGLYLEVKFKAQLFSSEKLTYNPTLYENQFPIYTIGERENVYAFNWTPGEGDDPDAEGPVYDMQTVRTMTLPSSLFDMAYLDLQTGEKCGRDADDEKENPAVNYDDKTENRFTIELSNPKFSYDPEKNLISVDPGESVAESCEISIIWKGGAVAFTSRPIALTVTVNWTDPQNSRYIAFDSQGGSSVKMISEKEGTAINAPADPVKTGYDFGGWYTQPEGAGSRYSIPAAMPAFDSENGIKGVTVYAKWIPRNDTRYTVQYYEQSANGSYIMTFRDSDYTGTTDSRVAPDVSAPQGFSYNEKKSTADQLIAPNGSTVVNVYFSRNKYNLTFTYGLQADEENQPVVYRDVKYGAAVYPPNMVLGGYEFKGWNTRADGSGDEVEFTEASVMPAENAVYHAEWIPASGIPFRVEYYIQDAENSEKFYYQESRQGSGTTGQDADLSSFISYGDECQFECSRVTADGAELYSAGAGGADLSDISVKVKGDGGLVVKLYFSRKIIDVSWDAGGEGGNENITNVKYRFGQTIARPAVNPERPGYVFAGWEGFSEGMKAGTENITFRARWNAGTGTQYTVEHYQQNISDDEYTLVSSDTERLSGTTGADTAAAAKQYEGFTAKVFSQAKINGDGSTVVKIYYDRNVHSLTWNLNGGAVSDGHAYTSGQVRFGTPINPPEPVKEGHGHSWNVTPAAVMPDSDLEYTAVWTAGQYTISFQSNGGSSVSGINAAYGADISGAAPQAPVKRGFEFAGWYTDSEFSGSAYIFDTMPLNGLILYAKWTAEEYSITYSGMTDAEYGENHPQKHVFGAETRISDPSRKGYTFTGWSVNGSAEAAAGEESGLYTNLILAAEDYDADITLEARWTVNSYTIAFDSKGGSSVSSISGDFGTAISWPQDPVRNGHTFAGWYYDESFSRPFAACTEMPALDAAAVTLYAKWTTDSYTITYNGVDSIPAGWRTAYSVSDTPFSLPVPEKTGYTFKGWTGNGITAPEISVTVAAGTAGNLVYTASWQANAYSVQFDGNQGSGSMDALTCYYDDAEKALPENAFARTGYAFTGWNTEAGGGGTAYSTGAYIRNLTAVNNGTVTLYAQWRLAEYTVSFDANGGSGAPDSIDCKYTEEYTLPSDVPSRTGYTFAGWTISGGSGKVYSPEESIQNLSSEDGAEIEMSAKWNANSYSVSFDANGGSSAPSSMSCSYDTAKSIPSGIPSRKGYTFTGWNTAADGSGSWYIAGSFTGTPGSEDAATSVTNLTAENNGSVTLYAQWSINTEFTYSQTAGMWVKNEKDLFRKFHLFFPESGDTASTSTADNNRNFWIPMSGLNGEALAAEEYKYMKVTAAFHAKEEYDGWQSIQFTVRTSGNDWPEVKYDKFETVSGKKGECDHSRSFTVDRSSKNNFTAYCLKFGATGAGSNNWLLSNLTITVSFHKTNPA